MPRGETRGGAVVEGRNRKNLDSINCGGKGEEHGWGWSKGGGEVRGGGKEGSKQT